MSLVKEFSADDKVYVAHMASAVRQDELLSLLTARIYASFQAAASVGSEMDEKATSIMLMSLPVDQKVKIVDILTEKVTLRGTEIRVSAKDFQGKMVAWNRFLAELLIWNLSDFFELLRSDQKADEAQAKESQVQ